MECVCGCGREVPKKLVDRNFVAATIALELLVWDKNRASPIPGPDGREGLIARGADCYQRLLYSLHEEGGGDPDADCDEWMRESARMRMGRSDMTKKRFLSAGLGAPVLSEQDVAELDRRHPELTFTGQRWSDAPAPDVSAPAPTAVQTPGDDIVERLERLRTLRDDGTLTDDEFAAAKARLLG